MSRKTLILESLPDDLDRVRSKLELYFRNKRRSGGDILELLAHPADKRTALLVYVDDAALQKVLSKRNHLIDFKQPLGLVELQVKLAEENVEPQIKRSKPLVSPHPDKAKLTLLTSTYGPSGVKPQLSACQADSVKDEDADALSLLVTSDCNKEFLGLYFDQFSSEQPTLRRHGNNTWILQLSSRSDKERVLAKEVHDYGISVVVHNEGTVEGQLDPRRFVLSGFDDGCSCSFVSVYIGSCSQGAEHAWEALDDGDRIVVTFQKDIDVKSFMKKCSVKKFHDKEIGACRLELTDSVLVEGNMGQISKEALNLYFSNKRSRGGDVKSLTWVSKDKSVVITFEDCHVAHRVAEHKHTFAGEVLRAQLFYSSLQRTLTGRTSLQQNITTNVVIPASAEVLRFINLSDIRKQEFKSELGKVHASVSIEMDTNPPQMELKMTMDKESLGMLRQGQSWVWNARKEARVQLEKYTAVQIPTEAEVWEGIEGSCLEFNTANVSISFKSSTSDIVLVGLQADVNALVEKVKGMVKKASDDLQIKRDTLERKIQLNSKEALGLIWDLVSGKIFDDVGLSKDDETFTICLKGLKNPVNTAEWIIKEIQDNVVSTMLDQSVHLLKFLNSLDLRKFERDHFAQNNIKAVLLAGEKALQIVVDKADIQRAKDKFHEVIKDEAIAITKDRATATRGEQWEQFMAALNRDLESSHNDQSISVILTREKIEVCGFSSVVADVLSKIRGYLENKKLVTEDVPLKSVQEVEFVESYMKLSEDPDLVALGVTVLPCKTQGFPGLKVTAASDKIKQAKEAVTLQVSTILTEKHMYLGAGEAKVLEKNNLMLMAKAKLLGCELNLSKSAPINHQQYNYDIEGCVTLTLGQGYISQHASDALICPLSSLDFDNPIAQQFLQSGGPEIKRVIDKCLKERQSLMAGDVVLTNPGTLKAKRLVYAVIPVWGKGCALLNTTYLQAAVHESLIRADKSQCVSLGMPALGCNTFGCPVKDSCESIIKGILKFIILDKRVLRNIYVIDSNAKVVAEFNSTLRDLGYHQTVVPNTTPPTPSRSAPSPPLPAKRDSNIKVIGGVIVILKKGDITKETVDVIVNSNNQICGSQKADGVVLTGGGNLNCKHIAQMAGPEKASDITAAIGKVLQLCESKMAATVAIPIIGTGRGGVDHKSSVMAIVKGVENHISQMRSSSLKRIFIMAFEDRIYDSIKICFIKRDRPQKRSQARASTSTQSGLPPNQVKIHGVRMEIRRGDITKETVKAIVNTTNSEVNATGGVSGAIFRAAGSAVEQECQNIRPLKGNEAGLTSGGDLQCDFIIHMWGPHSVAEATVRVAKVLERCEEKKITTVSFPALGTGAGGLTGTDSIGAMLQGIQDHLVHCASTALKLIYIVIDQDKIMQEFQQGLNQWKSNQAAVMDDEDGDDDEDSSSGAHSTASEEDDDTSSQTPNTTEILIGPVKVKLLCGDITKEKTDAIVSSTNTSLNLTSGVSGAILKAAGQTVIDECTALGTQPSDGAVITKPGNLPTKHIIHMVGQTKERDIISSMFKVLQMCEDHKLQSVSFPALSTGAGNMGALQVGKAMMTAIQDLVKSIKNPSLTTIHIVIFQTDMMKDFEEVMKQLKKEIPKAAAKKIHKPQKTSRPSQRTSATPMQQSTLCLATACRALSFPAMEAEVLGCSATSLVKVKKLMDDLVAEECYSRDLISRQLPLLLESEKQAIVALSEKNQVHVLVKAQDKATVSGKKDDVLATVLQITDFLQKAKERESRKGEEKRLRETLRWEAGEGDTWRELDPSISLDLELAWHDKKQTMRYSHQGETYTVQLRSMQQIDGKGTIKRIKRTLMADSDTAIIPSPSSWTRMDSKDLDIVELVPTSGEYKKVETEFIQTSRSPQLAVQPTIKVVKIQRIQSKDQWQRYSVKKQALDKKYPTNKNEMNLYHGTTADICQKIITNGFNRSFCGRNATMYGSGTYFAKESWYSCQDAYSNPDANGVKYMYRARVLVGKPCRGVQGMKEPDPLNPTDLRAGLHDCAVDHPQNPFIFVVFCDAGAYPDYLISFKTL